MLDIKYIWKLEVSKGYPDEVPFCFQLSVSKEVFKKVQIKAFCHLFEHLFCYG